MLKPTRDEYIAELGAIHAEMRKRALVRRLRAAIPTIFNPFFQSARYKGAYGGRGSAKSWSFAAMLILMCLMQEGVRAVCIREVQKSLGQSVKRLLEDTIARYGVGSQFKINSHSIDTPGRGLIIFQGMQDHTAESIKSLEGFNVAWVEEAQALSERSMRLLRPTLRRDDSELWFTWNPRHANDPVDAFLRGEVRPPRSIVIQVNYTDNPHLPQVLKEELEFDQRRDVDLFNHIWLGQYERHSSARVFKNWKIEEFETPDKAMFLFGGDFGFSIDPTVLVRCYLEGRNLYVDQEVYRVNCEIDHTPALYDSLACKQEHAHAVPCTEEHGTVCKLPHTDEERFNLLKLRTEYQMLYDVRNTFRMSEVPHELNERIKELERTITCWQYHGSCTGSHCDGMARDWEIIADSARPETISYLQRNGYHRITPAHKGPGSVEEGITFLQSYNIIVHPRCRHTIDELSMYSFKRHPLTDEVVPILEDKKNHVIDSLRYAAERLRGRAHGDFGVTV